MDFTTVIVAIIIVANVWMRKFVIMWQWMSALHWSPFVQTLFRLYTSGFFPIFISSLLYEKLHSFFYFCNLLTGACWSVFICACMNFHCCVTLYLYLFFISNINSINCAHLFYLGHICLRLFNVRKGVWTLLIYLGI